MATILMCDRNFNIIKSASWVAGVGTCQGLKCLHNNRYLAINQGSGFVPSSVIYFEWYGTNQPVNIKTLKSISNSNTQGGVTHNEKDILYLEIARDSNLDKLHWNGSTIESDRVSTGDFSVEGLDFDGLNYSGIFNNTALSGSMDTLHKNGTTYAFVKIMSTGVKWDFCTDGRYYYLCENTANIRMYSKTGSLVKTYTVTGSPTIPAICFDGKNFILVDVS